MRFQILGPIRVDADGHEVAITASRDRALLGALLLHANVLVQTDRLIDAIWDVNPPRNARNQLQGCVSRLRKRLGDAAIVTEPAGYRAVVDPEDLDLLEFRRLLAEARAATGAGRHDAAVASYRAALALWRGPALAGFESHPLMQAAAALEEERAQALQERLDTDLAAGGGGELVAELTVLVRQHPHREGLHSALMLALYRAGRQADALAAYRHARQHFLDELGTEPGTELQQLHHAILNRDSTLDVQTVARQEPSPSLSPRPRELPPDVTGFTGRAEALKTLDELMPDHATPSSPVVITAIAGTAGVGKTALAVHWAHRVSERFPDGQLYINLRGYAPGSVPLRPIEALSMLLRSLGLPPEQIPVEETEASARYRSVLADRRVLVVIDNARSVDQVRPLLPGSSGCLALVTSRDRLPGLVARDGARRITLDVLSADEAYALLTRLLGNERVEVEPQATADLANACACLPLALRIATALLDENPHRSIAGLVTELATGRRLDFLEIPDDQESAVRATFDLSYQAIPVPAQRLFRLLGLVPGPDFTTEAAAALSDLSHEHARELLKRLTTAHLVNEYAAGRFTFHDLLRLYANERTRRDDTDVDRSTALTRLFSWYLSRTDAVNVILQPTGSPLALPPDLLRFASPSFASRHEALAFLDAERANIVAAVQHASDHGPRPIAWLLADRLRRYYRLRPGNDAIAVGVAAEAAAEVEGSQRDQAIAQLPLAEHYLRRGEDRKAVECYERALIHARQAGELELQCTAHNAIGVLCTDLGRLSDARSHLETALSISQQAGLRRIQTVSLSTLAHLNRAQGNLWEAVSHFERSLALVREDADQISEVTEQANLGHVYLLIGDLKTAMDITSRALDELRKLRHWTAEAETLRIIAAVHDAAGRPSEALECANTALSLTVDTDDRREIAIVMNVLAGVQHSIGDDNNAVVRYRQAAELAEPDGFYPKIEALIGLAGAESGLGNGMSATAHALEALELAGTIGYKILEGRALTALAEISFRERDSHTAYRYAQRALENHRRTGHRLGEARTLILIGHVEAAEGDVPSALYHWRAARRLFENNGAPVPAEVVEGLR